MSYMKTLMLVDDIEISNFILKMQLESIRFKGEVHEFTEAEKAFALIDDIHPDIIFLDINMPGMDGWKFLTQMEKENKNYKVIMLTSSTSKIDQQKAATHPNVIAYSTKPIELDNLQAYLNL